jgi:hypothetical protein
MHYTKKGKTVILHTFHQQASEMPNNFSFACENVRTLHKYLGYAVTLKRYIDLIQ